MNEQKIEKWKILETEYLSKEPWFTARRDKVELPSGKIIPAYYVLEYPAWVCIIGLTKDNKMVMIRQYRHGLGQVSYELCAGVVEASDDSYLDAARRELLEETGFGNGHWRQFMMISANPSTHTNMTYCFLAEGLEQISSQHLEDTEDIAVELMESDDVLNLLERDEMPQATHVAPLWKYFYTRKEGSER